MTRKSKQPGGHNPLTYHERKSKLADYGTEKRRLGADSQLQFGDCCLGLVPAVDPVATPSGHIYSREAILTYLLNKTQELKDAKAKYEAQLKSDANKQQQQDESKQVLAITNFCHKDQGSSQLSTEQHSQSYNHNLSRKIDNQSKEELQRGLKRTSYWLCDSQPEDYTSKAKEEERRKAPPDRPPSPMSGQPLRRKDLISITLQRENDTDGGKASKDQVGHRGGKCVCAVSLKAITTQPAIAIKPSGAVMLKDVYDSLVVGKKKKDKESSSSSKKRACPVTGKTFKDKDVIMLQKGTSGYAASGEVFAKKYKPTLT